MKGKEKQENMERRCAMEKKNLKTEKIVRKRIVFLP